VKLTGGTKYRLEMTSDDFDAFLVVQDQGGKQLAFDDDSGGNLNAKLDFTAPADGTYKIFAAAFKGVGKFTLTVRPLEGGGGTAQPVAGKVYTLDQGSLKIEGKVETTDKEVLVRPDPGAPKSYPMRAKEYPVKMAGGAKYRLEMASDEFDAFLVVQDAGGKQLAFDDDGGGNLNAKLDFTAPADGTYKVFAASFKGTGKFTLTVKQQGEVKEKQGEVKEKKSGGRARSATQEGPKGKAHTVGPDGLKLTGELSDEDKRVEVVAGNQRVRLPAKMHLVQLMAGAKYRLEMVSPTLDSFLVVQDQGGKQLAFDDDSGGGANGLDAKLDFTPPQNGTYKVFAASNAKETKPGKYTLTVRRLGGGAGDGKVHEVGKDGLELKGTLDATNQERTYQVKLAEGKTYVIDMLSPDQKALDPYLRLHDAEGKKLKEDDDGGEGLNARITFQAPATATYRIVATSFLNRGRGEFTLKVREK
jgi:hypothetical protein